MPNSSIKDEKTYKKLRQKGESKEKSARIANASAAQGKSAQGKSKVSSKGGKSGSYDDMTVPQLRKRAAEVGIGGRSKMNKEQLVKALRNH
jgi:hypothetical protein